MEYSLFPKIYKDRIAAQNRIIPTFQIELPEN